MKLSTHHSRTSRTGIAALTAVLIASGVAVAAPAAARPKQDTSGAVQVVNHGAAPATHVPGTRG